MVMLAAGVIALDQLTKAVIVATIEPDTHLQLIGSLQFINIRNQGVAFGLLAVDAQWAFIAFTLVALAILFSYFAVHHSKRLFWLATGLIAGGALSNLIDRLLRDGVVDFIDFGFWPAFNLADCSITVGIVALLFVLGDKDG
jgi:signal peptidase II